MLRVAVGGLLLIFGLQWLRKAILRSTGLKAKHDEIEAFSEETAAARAAGPVGDDWRTALGVVIALGATALVANAGASARWVMPPAAVLLLALSLRRASQTLTRR